MSDPTRRPLNFPNWHIPYLEKHRILELFHEIAREMVIQKPDDHVLFMKQILQTAAASRDVSRVILISSSKINRINLAEQMSKLTRQIVITSHDLEHMMSTKSKLSGDEIGKILTYMVRTQSVANCGYIIADCINTEEEAKSLLQYGVLPTHVIHVVPPFQPELNDLLYCKVSENWPETRRNLFALKDIFKKTLKQVFAHEKDLYSLAKECVDLCRIRPHVKRVRPRVVIIGPRGCGRRTQARYLNQTLGLVNINFDYILCQAWTSSSELGTKLRQCRKEVCFHSELLCQIVNKRVLEQDCIEHGWVLTGYPFTDVDFKFLDSIETPPNRVVIIDCDLNVCKDRILYRKLNVYTGSVTKLAPDNAKEDDPTGKKKVLQTHPRDVEDLIDAEHRFYCENYGSIKKYCGETVMVVNGDQSDRWVHETITAHVVGANPPGSPRKGFGKEIPDVCSCDCINVPGKVAKTYMLTV
ncbi:adenylate kinase 8 [Sitophilus oryzae]|uniref:Adenylate kinase 8 n=1 Tax=Sitophilus oryzae TaxID=7048 RepID=A0A6J2YRT6_SITOR|nr:adenylate kinase 8 [Sitophilus oryzae]